MTVAEAVVRALEDRGAGVVFGIPGTHLLPLFRSLAESKGLRAVLARHEGAAAFMADGYAKVSGGIGVCCGTTGPGATNLVTGVATAFMDSTPVLALTAAVPTAYFGRGALQEGTGIGRTVSHAALFRGITKFQALVGSPGEIGPALEEAFRAMRSGRPGPAHLDLPVNVQNASLRGRPSLPAEATADRPAPTDAQLRDVLDLLRRSRRPAILAGGGVIAAGAAAAVRRLSERLSAPVATSLKGRGTVDEAADLALGAIGLFGQNAGNAYLRSQADLLIALGCSFHEFTTQGFDPALKRGRLVQVDVDARELGKNYSVDAAVRADALVFLERLLAALEAEPAAPAGCANGAAGLAREAVLRLRRKYGWFDEPVSRSEAVPLKPQRVMRELRAALPREAIVFAESVTWTERYLQIHEPGTYVVGTGLASLGYGTAACLGGALAAAGRPVVCVCGDGGFQFHAMELLTAAADRIPAIWVVLNNARLGVIWAAQRRLYGNRILCTTLLNPDFRAFAASVGVDGYRAVEPGDTERFVRLALERRRPALVEVVIDPDEQPPHKPRILEQIKASGLEPARLGLANLPGLLAMLGEK